MKYDNPLIRITVPHGPLSDYRPTWWKRAWFRVVHRRPWRPFTGEDFAAAVEGCKARIRKDLLTEYHMNGLQANEEHPTHKP